MKPTLFLNVGTGWSGTTPLYYTLGWYNKYCHAGHRKEKGYLWLINLAEEKKGKDYRIRLGRNYWIHSHT